MQILENQVYGKAQTFSHVGMFVWKNKAAVLDDVLVKGNAVSFVNNLGDISPWWDGRNATALTVADNKWNVEYIEPQPQAGIGPLLASQSTR